MGGSTNAVLRGFKSLTQSNQALFVVDGVPYDNTITTGGGYDFGSAASDLNPDDIASINVLKGAAASALYGSRGSNGVILITTKKGSNRKGVGVTATFGVSAGSPDKSTLPTYQTTYGEGYGATADGNFYSETVPWLNSGGTPDNHRSNRRRCWQQEQYMMAVRFITGMLSHRQTLIFINQQPGTRQPNHNPTDYFVTPITTTEAVLVQGGGDKGTFKFGYTRDDETWVYSKFNHQERIYLI